MLEAIRNNGTSTLAVRCVYCEETIQEDVDGYVVAASAFDVSPALFVHRTCLDAFKASHAATRYAVGEYTMPAIYLAST